MRGKLVQMLVQLFLFAAIVHMLRFFGEFAGAERANHLRRWLSADEAHLMFLIADHKSPLKVPEGFVGFVGRSWGPGGVREENWNLEVSLFPSHSLRCR